MTVDDAYGYVIELDQGWTDDTQQAYYKGCFKLMIQFQSNAEDMPVENPMVEWDEDTSPFIEVASIRIPSQTFRAPEQIEFCENLSFTPYHDHGGASRRSEATLGSRSVFRVHLLGAALTPRGSL